MTDLQSLDQLPVGKQARIYRLAEGTAIGKRLRDLGLIEGTAVTCVGRAAGNQIAAYEIRGAIIAIRKSDAQEICILNMSEKGIE